MAALTGTDPESEDREPEVPAPGASARERDEAAMAWLRWYHRRATLGTLPVDPARFKD